MSEASQEVFQTMDKLSIVGVVLEKIEASTITTKKNYEELRKKAFTFPSGNIGVDNLEVILKDFIDQEEVIVVTFRKVKNNGKIGHKKDFNKGFAYYVGIDPNKLSKIYVHWEEEKQFLLKNLRCLRKTTFIVDSQLVKFTQNMCCLDICLSVDSGESIADISICLGYKN